MARFFTTSPSHQPIVDMHYYIATGSCSSRLAGSPALMLSHTSPCEKRATVAPEDFDLMFHAVADRLRVAAGAHAKRNTATTVKAVALDVIVLECVEAFEQLHRELTARRMSLEVSVLQEGKTGSIVSCWASPLARSQPKRRLSSGARS